MRPEKVAGVSYTIPPKYHIESRGVYKKKKKNDRVHFNYLGSDVLLSTIYNALETNAKYINCLDVQKLFHSTTMYMYILYLVNNWFVSFN